MEAEVNKNGGRNRSSSVQDLNSVWSISLAGTEAVLKIFFLARGNKYKWNATFFKISRLSQE